MTTSGEQARPVGMKMILAMTHGYPADLDTHIRALSYFNQKPGSVIDDTEHIGKYILSQAPKLRAIRPPQAVKLDDDAIGYSERDGVIWDAWADVIIDLLGPTLTIAPLPAELRDMRSPSEKLIALGADPQTTIIANPEPQSE